MICVSWDGQGGFKGGALYMQSSPLKGWVPSAKYITSNMLGAVSKKHNNIDKRNILILKLVMKYIEHLY